MPRVTQSAAERRERPPHNLPDALTSFVGRKRELAEVKRLLTRGESRLVTLTGPGGCGKTRLALRAANELVNQFVDGVWRIELAALTDPALLPQAVATVLGVREQPNHPLLDLLRDYLRPKRTLLVLDNCEHLLDACRSLVDALLPESRAVRILATSRERLGLAGETTWLVPSLTLPPVGKEQTLRLSKGRRTVDESRGTGYASVITEYDAVRLFVERGRDVHRRFVLTDDNAPNVAHICRRLEGIPLAIELASARVKVLSVEQIAQRLDDALRLLTLDGHTEARHHTLRATLDWSYDLLSESERILLRRLSVFAGGFTLDAAEAVCSDAEEQRTKDEEVLRIGLGPSPVVLYPLDVLDILTHLIDQSLVAVVERDHGPACYRLLEPIRQYSETKLREASEAQVIRRRHLDYFLALATADSSQLRGPQQVAALARLDSEYDNCRAALEWGLQSGAKEAALLMVGALGRFWQVRGYLHEGRQWATRVLAPSPADGPTSASARAKALVEAGRMESALLHFAQSHALLTESLSLYRDAEDAWGVAFVISRLGAQAMCLRDYTQARTLLQESLALARELRDDWMIAHNLCHLGELSRLTGDYSQAGALYGDSQALFRSLGDEEDIAITTHNLGYVVLYQGDSRRAAALFREALTLAQQYGSTVHTAWCLAGLASAAVVAGQPERSARLSGAAERLFEALGTHLDPQDRAEYDRYMASTRAALGEQPCASLLMEGRALSVDQAVAYALKTTQDTRRTLQKAGQAVAPSSPLLASLTRREREVVALVAHGLTNDDIAARLFVSTKAVEKHVSNILGKLGYERRLHIATWAVENGLAEPAPDLNERLAND